MEIVGKFEIREIDLEDVMNIFLSNNYIVEVTKKDNNCLIVVIKQLSEF